MRAVRIHAPHVFGVDRVAEPTPAAADALVRIEACGICGSDLAYIDAGVTGFGRESSGPSCLAGARVGHAGIPCVTRQ